ncbi:hypothetical protein GJ744_004345 [Endocarpon pusillum]|uniref:Prion-inhibition and propagation HeLo domain-containing protein n=1 Tax=Endocarpon pusillum TaxID=364733 RepID=A0A8H7A6K2_9EURO|nr:hypothetical protein GJ744_004345 [Endocarpon pusillum]
MAEAVGLTLGTVALASLFSVCVELINYFELGKSYEYDYDLACLKLYLLKVRLDKCGKTMSIDDTIHMSQEFRQHWPQEQDVVVRSLLGIRDIFGNAALLKDKYRLVPNKSNNIFSIFPAVRAKSSTVTGHSSSSSSRLPNSRGRFSLFRRSTTWVIRDKQKFDALLSDLEFFISNLNLLFRSCDNMSDNTVLSDEPTQNGQAGTSAWDRKSQSKEKQEGSIAHPRDGGSSLSKCGRCFKIGKKSAQTLSIQGVLGKVEATPIPPGQHESFIIANTTGQSISIQGISSDQSILNALKHQQAVIQTMNSGKSNGSQNARQTEIFDGPGRRLGEQ